MIGPDHSIICRLTSHRARRGGVDDRLQRREVEAAALLLGQLEHPDEHRRHHLRVGDAVALDELEARDAASKRSITTHVPPNRWTAMLKRSGAAWYSGAGER